MAGLPEEVRDRTDALDAVGNTTAAIAKGFAIASAGLSAISLFVSYQATMHHSIPDFALTLTDPLIVAGIFIGAMMPFMFAALTMGAVSRAAHAMVEEVRRQFREIKGIMEYKAEPEYDKCVAISTSSALREMMLPGCLAIVVPVLIGCFNPAMLGGFLAVSYTHLDVYKRQCRPRSCSATRCWQRLVPPSPPRPRMRAKAAVRSARRSARPRTASAWSWRPSRRASIPCLLYTSRCV